MSFSENIIQTSHVNVYYPGAANCGSGTSCNSTTPIATCSGCDWEFGQVSCNQGCPSQPACSAIDGNTCPALGQNIQYEWNTSNGTCPIEPTVECTYDASTFTYNDVVKYQEQFGKESFNYNNVIMPEFCFKSTTICPIVPGTSSSWQSCPNILSNIGGQSSGNAGADCSDWASNNTLTSDTEIQSYCSSNTSDNTCQCANRTNSAVYNYINAGMRQSGNYSPSCWYTSCANPQAYLVPSTLTGANCNSTEVCARVNNIIRTTPTNLTRDQLQAELNCDITATPSRSSNSSSIPLTPLVTDNTIGSVKTSSSWWIWIIIGIIFIIFIIILFLFISA